MLRDQSLLGPAIRQQLEPLAQLRLSVFRDWPYLYQGTLDYERHYLDAYCRSPQALAVLVWDGTRCVAASTALPMNQAAAEMRLCFEQAGIETGNVLYFGESVVLPDYRGRGIGRRFFELREAHARSLGLSRCAFCAVERPAEHPLKPEGHVGNEGFWTRRGYRHRPELVCHYDWQDLDQPAPSSHRLSFWTRDLA